MYAYKYSLVFLSDYNIMLNSKIGLIFQIISYKEADFQ